MALSKLKSLNVSAGNWPADCINGQRMMLDLLLQVCNDTMNSWKEVHDDFDELQGYEPEPTPEAFAAFYKHCTRVAHLEGQTPSKYHVELVAYALLKEWIKYHAAEVKFGNLPPNDTVH